MPVQLGTDTAMVPPLVGPKPRHLIDVDRISLFIYEIEQDGVKIPRDVLKQHSRIAPSNEGVLQGVFLSRGKVLSLCLVGIPAVVGGGRK